MHHPKETLNILGHTIKLGEAAEAKFSVAKLHTSTLVDVPVIIHSLNGLDTTFVNSSNKKSLLLKSFCILAPYSINF